MVMFNERTKSGGVVLKESLQELSKPGKGKWSVRFAASVRKRVKSLPNSKDVEDEVWNRIGAKLERHYKDGMLGRTYSTLIDTLPSKKKALAVLGKV